MPDLTKEELEVAHKRFEELGRATVEAMIQREALPQHWILPAITWIGEQDKGKK